MPPISDDAILLQRTDYSETSQILVFFTRGHGKVRAIGKGLKKSTKTRFAVGIDLLDGGRLTVSAKSERSEQLAIVIEWKQTIFLSGLRERLDRLYAAQYVAEITSNLIHDWDPYEALFDALLVALRSVADTTSPMPLLVTYQQQLLLAVGSLPMFDGCVLCGRCEELTFFSSFEGGMVCRDCEPNQVEKREVAVATLEALRLSGESAGSLGAFDLLNYHIAHLMGRQPRLAEKVAPASVRRTSR